MSSSDIIVLAIASIVLLNVILIGVMLSFRRRWAPPPDAQPPDASPRATEHLPK
ncbi:MAG TPA: hypothetical protein VF807_10305 [Ktedonobacterales bacterium]